MRQVEDGRVGVDLLISHPEEVRRFRVTAAEDRVEELMVRRLIKGVGDARAFDLPGAEVAGLDEPLGGEAAVGAAQGDDHLGAKVSAVELTGQRAL